MKPSTRKDILSRMPYGLYVVGCRASDNTLAAIVANWVSQVSFSPPLLSIALEAKSEMKHHFDAGNFFSLNMLKTGSSETAKLFLKKAQRSKETLQGKSVTVTQNGTPLLTDAAASLECKIIRSFPLGDHVIFVGEIVDAVSRDAGDFLTLKETGWKYSR